MKIYDCRVNHLVNPLGYKLETPSFSWKVSDSAGSWQTSARIKVFCGNCLEMDTGWKKLSNTGTILPLSMSPYTRYTWKVSVRTDAGEECESELNWFETAKMKEPWTAKWIECPAHWDQNGRHPIFSRKIRLSKQVTAARLYICGLGLYEATWNGEKIGDELLTPYSNNYNVWLQYQTYDVTKQLQTNGILSVLLGNGWYKGRFGFDNLDGTPFYGTDWKMIAELRLKYKDGTIEIIGTDETWEVTSSNITFSNLYDGEHRNDCLIPLKLQQAVVTEAPQGTLTARYSTPVKVRKSLSAKILHTPAGETVLDIGQNQAGIFRLKANLPKGQKIHLQFGEILQNGNFYRENLRSAKSEYWYVSDGHFHVLQPKFTYYGYRYVKVEGIPELKSEDFEALSIYSELPPTGKLKTGNAKVNRLINNAAWGQKSNFIDVPTDCPQRDERMGWTGDAQVFSQTACYFRDCYAFYAKYLHDLATEQEQHGGAVPMVAPAFGKNDSAAAWGDAACIIPWTVYTFYGDTEILRHQYDAMVSWLNYVGAIDRENYGWAKRFHFGDWLALDGKDPSKPFGGTDAGMIALWYYRHSLLLTAQTARILGKDKDALHWQNKADRIKMHLRKTWFTEDGHCKIHTQTALLLALQDDVSPKRSVSEKELQDILAESDGMLKTGFVGTPLLCSTLTEIGAEKDAFRLLLNEEYPGWLYAVKLGATTIWERWNSVGSDGRIAENGMNSLNHYAYGSVVSWIFSHVAGLKPAEPGFRRAYLEPHFCKALKYTVMDYESAMGSWHVEWKILSDGQVSYCCMVPFDCTARLILPYGGGTYELVAGTFQKIYQPNQELP